VPVYISNIGAFQAYLRRLDRVFFSTAAQREIFRETLRRSRTPIVRLYRAQLRENVEATTTTRTGTLLRTATVKSRVANRGLTLILRPDFPRTKYTTPSGRGRPRASKQGQWAFVVNGRRGFIKTTFDDVANLEGASFILGEAFASTVRDALHLLGRN